jgi:hypothetical protein
MRKNTIDADQKQRKINITGKIGYLNAKEAWELFVEALDLDLTPLIGELQNTQQISLSLATPEKREKYQQYLDFRDRIKKQTGVFLKERDLIEYAIRFRTNKK